VSLPLESFARLQGFSFAENLSQHFSNCSNKYTTCNRDCLTIGDFCCYTLSMGRPKKKDFEAKTFMLRIRMTGEDRELLEQAAKRKSLQMSSWARSELIELARKLLSKK